MVVFDRNRACEDAATYYHDFLLDPKDPSIPSSVVDHIKGCTHCGGQVRRLGEVLAEAEGASQRDGAEADQELIAELQLHFEHLGGQVACAQAKPLLPSLLIPSLKMRIPTPVTAHVDHCAECAEDLAALRELHLDSAQLTRLSRLYAAASGGDPRTCREAQSAVALLGSAVLESVDAEVLQHLCRCRSCRESVYEYRQRLLDRLRCGCPDQDDVCGRDVSFADIFDCVVPYGRAGTDGVPTSRQQKVAGAHLRSCVPCLEKMQALHRIVYGIAERADSDVATVYTTKSVGREACEEAEGLYAGHPIDVEVIRREPEPVAQGSRSKPGVRAALRRGASHRVVKTLLRTAFPIAAIIPLAILFWVSTPSASGLSVRQVDLALAGASAVHISRFPGNGAEPIHELWISRATNTIISETRTEQTVYNLAAGRKIMLKSNPTSVQYADLSAEDRRQLKQWMERYLEWSFADTVAGKLVKCTVTEKDPPAGHTEAYELTGETPVSDETTMPYRWVLFVDPLTKRPIESRLYTMPPKEDGWGVDAIRRFEYPDDREIEARLEAVLPAS